MITTPASLPFQHIEVITLLVWILILIACFAVAGLVWFTARTIKKVDMNQTEMFRRLQLLERDFYELRGEHNRAINKRHQ